MKVKIKRGKTILMDGQYLTEVMLNVHYLSIDYWTGINYSKYININRYTCIFSEEGEFRDIQYSKDKFDDETLFLFNHYHKGRFQSKKTIYRISSKKVLGQIYQNFQSPKNVSGDLITDLMLSKCDGRITTDYSEWSREVDLLFTGDDFVKHPIYKEVDDYDLFIDIVKMKLRKNKVSSLIKNIKNRD